MGKRIYGEIPGYSEGHLFENRQALHDAGVHRPLMAGIAGSELEAAESIVLSGGYEDDADYGEIIVYTGQGGNDPATKKQVGPQELTRGNLALVHNLLEGIPVRVVRGSNHHSPHSPRMGYAYAGLYLIEDFWHEIGISGFRIWRYRLRKEGSSPTPQLPPSQVHEDRESYGGEKPGRLQLTISRIIRNTAVAAKVKQMHNYTCQVCGERLMTPGGPYAEAAHIKPLGQPHNGPDTADNILCLCPNHHLLFDTGALTIDDDMTVTQTRSPLRTVKGHTINLEYVRYHRAHYG
jgi:putative restriction endonuclease